MWDWGHEAKIEPNLSLEAEIRASRQILGGLCVEGCRRRWRRERRRTLGT